jgi:putative YphP/YqiW family bacilliredoxin
MRAASRIEQRLKTDSSTPTLLLAARTYWTAQDVAATERARSYFKGYFPSSPSVAILQNGKTVFMLERHQIEGRDPAAIARDLTDAFDRLCVPSVKS